MQTVERACVISSEAFVLGHVRGSKVTYVMEFAENVREGIQFVRCHVTMMRISNVVRVQHFTYSRGCFYICIIRALDECANGSDVPSKPNKSAD